MKSVFVSLIPSIFQPVINTMGTLINKSVFPGDFLFQYDSLNQLLMIKLTEEDTLRTAVDFNMPPDSHYISYISGEPIEFISGGISSNVVMGGVYEVEFDGTGLPSGVCFYGVEACEFSGTKKFILLK